jgi:hypothetical protein
VWSLWIGLNNYSKRKTPEVEIEDGNNSYIAQKTWNSCGYAVMAMLIADKKEEDVGTVYRK